MAGTSPAVTIKEAIRTAGFAALNPSCAPHRIRDFSRIVGPSTTKVP
jgi:hypothetical protein